MTAAKVGLVAKGNVEVVVAAQEVIEDAGLSPSLVKEDYDIWAIYRALLAGSTARPTGEA